MTPNELSLARFSPGETTYAWWFRDDSFRAFHGKKFDVRIDNEGILYAAHSGGFILDDSSGYSFLTKSEFEELQNVQFVLRS